MSLIVEDGTIVNGADTFVTVAALRAYAAKRGATLPATGSAGDAACEVLLIKAMDYIQGQEPRFKGERVFRDQDLCWPREEVVVNGFCIASNLIPSEVKQAQMVLAIEAQAIELQPTLDASEQRGPVTSEKVDVVEVSYAAPAVVRDRTAFAKADAFLHKLYKGGGSSLPVARA